MGYLIVNWVLSALGLFIVSAVLPGFRVLDFQAALLAAGLVGLLSAIAAGMLRRANSPASLGISSIFLIAADTFLFRLSALLIPGFAMTGFFPAVAGAVVLLTVSLVLLRAVRSREEEFPSETSAMRS
jgi:putative membrane protein